MKHFNNIPLSLVCDQTFPCFNFFVGKFSNFNKLCIILFAMPHIYDRQKNIWVREPNSSLLKIYHSDNHVFIVRDIYNILCHVMQRLYKECLALIDFQHCVYTLLAYIVGSQHNTYQCIFFYSIKCVIYYHDSLENVHLCI